MSNSSVISKPPYPKDIETHPRYLRVDKPKRDWEDNDSHIDQKWGGKVPCEPQVVDVVGETLQTVSACNGFLLVAMAESPKAVTPVIRCRREKDSEGSVIALP
jgi:hypothetical protein